MNLYIRICPLYIHTYETFEEKFMKFTPETSGHFSKPLNFLSLAGE